jgi:hypothetical protein
VAYARYTIQKLVYIIYHLAVYTNKSLKYAYSEYHLANQVYVLPVWAPKPYLSCTSYRKGRAGGAVGSKIDGKKGRSSKRGGTRVFSVVITSI